MVKERLRLILQTITRELSVTEACEKLQIQRPRFAELRAMALQGGADALEPGVSGRPRKRDADRDQELEEIKAENERLQKELHTAEIRAALAGIIPYPLPDKQKKGSTSKEASR